MHAGSCYAFAAADTIASLHAIRTKQLIELSPKEIVDCCNCGGCNGGKMHDAFLYVANNKGLTTAKNYPYKPVAETCNVKKVRLSNACMSQIKTCYHHHYHLISTF